MYDVYHDSFNSFLKHWFDKKCQPNREDEVSDEESSTHSPHQPQQVEGVETGPLRHTGLAFMDYAGCGGKIYSKYSLNNEYIYINVDGT